MGRGEYGGGNGMAAEAGAGAAAAAAAAAMPGWLGGLVEESFFVGCGAHESRKKNEKNIFCLDCCTSICPHCAPAHPSHPLLQVRSSSSLFLPSSSVSPLPELTNHLPSFLCSTHKKIGCIDLSFSVKKPSKFTLWRSSRCALLPSYAGRLPYTINSAKVVFLKPRPQSRPFKGSGNICLTCDRILQEPFHFCSLSCKVDHVLLQGEDLSSILFRFNDSDLAFSHFENLRVDSSDLLIEDDGQVTPSSTLEERHGCSASANGGRGSLGKKKKTGSFFPQIVLSLSNRRKGAPHRSPLS
ncbi:PLATZ transcription factor [Musa troglodytarum]|uniref:PLATZ transcription factor n=1 Tax=Musa troglodytarum TaxID=320322 RepID=A0A9E7KJ18_9LILI|nr:PLATZ transcription factor [Musa troglodytarum]